MADLQPGHRQRLPELTALEVVTTLEGEHAAQVRTAIVLAPEGRMGSSPTLGVVDAVQRSIHDGAIRFTEGPGSYHIALDEVRGRCQKLLVVMWVSEEVRKYAACLAQLSRMRVQIREPGGDEILHFDLDPSTLGLEAAILHSEIYYKDGWRFKANGLGFLGGLPTMASRLAIDVDTARRMDAPQRAAASAEPSFGRFQPVRLPGSRPAPCDPGVPGGLVGAVARVFVLSDDDQRYTGTAFAVTPGGCMVTCEHVVEDAVGLAVLFPGEEEVRPALVMAHESQGDVAVIRLVDSWGVQNWLELDLGTPPPGLGTEVGLLGYPGGLGHEINYSQGIINSIRSREDVKVLQVDAGAASGSSGGPLFRRDNGRVVGVIGAVVQSTGMHANLATHVGVFDKLGWFGS